ncbi:hypothetical protein SAMN05421797_107155 [Maribacter ulvicola]|uniref:Uncharacterized protein n=1 Tax=Maribacter ulvicola TaxID=228959 RepID=A0A1N6YUT6_9FLAO|nr:hypothetical protein SAMN05421797_107155 [Maribacter ulvicola]
MRGNLSLQPAIILAWNMAITSNHITKKLIFYSDSGLQWASYRFSCILKSYNRLENKA